MNDFLSEKLSKSFYRWEFTVSETAARRSIANTPSLKEWDNLKALCDTCLEPARTALGALRINSGYRCSALNTAIGGAPNSQHIYGQAADVIPMHGTLVDLFEWLHSNVPFDQLIWEFGSWVHISHVKESEQRHQTLIAYKKNGRTLYMPITDEQVSSLGEARPVWHLESTVIGGNGEDNRTSDPNNTRKS